MYVLSRSYEKVCILPCVFNLFIKLLFIINNVIYRISYFICRFFLSWFFNFLLVQFFLSLYGHKLPVLSMDISTVRPVTHTHTPTQHDVLSPPPTHSHSMISPTPTPTHTHSMTPPPSHTQHTHTHTGQYFTGQLLCWQEYTYMGFRFWWLSQVSICSRPECILCHVCSWNSPNGVCWERWSLEKMGCGQFWTYSDTWGK